MKRRMRSVLFQNAIGETIRFGLVGVINTVVDFTVFLLLIHLFRWNVLAAQTASYAFGLVNSYAWNRKVTFRGKGKPKSGEVTQFVILNLVSYLASVLMLSVMRWLPISNVVSKMLVTLVTFVINFVGSKRWVFQHSARVQIMDN